MMNVESSRSHLIISVVIESTNLQTQSSVKGKLSFVDLAGSERIKKSGSTGEQLKEAQVRVHRATPLLDQPIAIPKGRLADDASALHSAPSHTTVGSTLVSPPLCWFRLTVGDARTPSVRKRTGQGDRLPAHPRTSTARYSVGVGV